MGAIYQPMLYGVVMQIIDVPDPIHKNWSAVEGCQDEKDGPEIGHLG
jgi:hypothetical protein